MKKDELRTIYKEKRLALSEQQKQALEASILQKLKDINYAGIQYIHTFLPIARWNEFNTFPYLEWLRKSFPDLNIVISVSSIREETLRHFLFDDSVRLKENKWGIPEPMDTDKLKEIDPAILDIVLVPMLIGDQAGNRVGYGKGFYDRFLRLCRPDVQKIGISFFSLIVTIEDIDEWDVTLDTIIYPSI